MEPTKISLANSVYSKLFAVLLFFFSIGTIVGGLFIILRSFFLGTHQFLIGTLLTSSGLAVVISTYNLILFFEAIKNVTTLAEKQAEILNMQTANSIQAADIKKRTDYLKNSNPNSLFDGIMGMKISMLDMDAPGQEPKTFNSLHEMMEFMSNKRIPNAPSIDKMSYDELESERKKAIDNQEFERASLIRDELAKRNNS